MSQMMVDNEVSWLRLAELMCTKLCHDISGPIGAVNNGVEFLSEEDSKMEEQAIELIASSAKSAVNRVQFFRQCYGVIKFPGEADISELRQLTQDFFADSRIKVDWPAEQGVSPALSLSRKMGKLLLNMVMIVAGTLIQGGTLAVRLEKAGEEGGVKMRVLASGPSIRLEPAVERVLSNDANSELLDPKTVHPFFTVNLARSLDASLSHRLSKEAFELSVERLND